ncbi:MAG: baseplate J/gp47 family protein [Spirochaetales bacterium]|nr:baseplate J/gp47 family protein [Spirochaetales bacterium]
MKIETTKSEVLNEIITDLKASPAVFKNFTFNPLSRLYTLVRAIAFAIYVFIDTRLVTLLKAIHPHTSEEDDLHEWLRRYGLSWKQASRAIHNVRIGSENLPEITDISIPQGLIVSTAGAEEDKVRFRVLTSGKLLTTTPEDSNGYYTVLMQVEALVPGIAGNVAKNAIAVIENGPAGLEYVNNFENNPTVPGTERESIASVRNRIALAEVAQVQSMWTENWYLSEALSFEFVERVAFRSAKTLGLEGEIKLLCRGQSGFLTGEQKTELLEHFDAAERNPGGVAHVLIDDLEAVIIERTVQVIFSDISFIPSDSELMAMAEAYLYALADGENWIDPDFRSPFFTLQGVIGVSVTPMGDETIPVGSVGVYGEGFTITGVTA